jgi:nucleoside-diphosphate-sugar epimerase
MHSSHIVYDKFSVGIIGCGWLGRALALQLQQQGIDVFATRSNTPNVKVLQSSGIKSEVLSLPEEQLILNKHPVFTQNYIVIAITPQFRRGKVDYANKIQQLVVAAKLSKSVEKIILVSTTSAYNGLFGQVDETSELNETADNVALIQQAEQAVLGVNQQPKNDGNDSTDVTFSPKLASVLRLSGLVGPGRHPGNFLKHGRMFNSPEASVNLIHQDDAVGLISALLKNNTFSGIVNGVSQTTATKAQYYSAAAKALNIPEPCFNNDNSADNNTNTHNELQPSKKVSGNKARTSLHYPFVYDDLLAWLEHIA